MKSRNPHRRNRIIDVAGQLFAHQGYHGTSTREIARIAEISENTLFRYFGHKEDLFWASLQARLSGLKLRKELLVDIARGADPGIVLPQILGQLVDTLIRDPESLNLIAVAFIELRWKAESFCVEYFAPIFAAVKGYLTVSMEAGRLRKFDPSIVTAALAATVMVHSRMSGLISGGPAPYADSREAVSAYSQFWVTLLAGHGLAQDSPVDAISRLRLGESSRGGQDKTRSAAGGRGA